MKKRHIIIVVLITLLFAFYMLINKGLNMLLSGPMLEEVLINPIEKKLGRDVEIGSIKVSLFKGINISEVIIKDLGSVQDLASIESFVLAYDLWSLLNRQLIIKSVDINKLKINVVRYKTGLSNIETIGTPGPKKEEEPNYDVEPFDPLPLDLTFDRVSINNAELSFKDMTGELPNVEADTNATLSLILGKSLGDTVLKGTVSIHANSEYKNKEPVLMLEATFTQKSISFQGDLSIVFDKFIFDGQIDNYISSPEITLNVNSPKLNLDNMLALLSTEEAPPKAAPTQPVVKEKKEPLPESVTQPATNQRSETMPSGDADKVTIAPQTPEPEVTTSDKQLGFSCLGEITITELVSKDFKADNIKAFYNLKEKTLHLKNIAADMFGGNLGGNIYLIIVDKAPPIGGNISAKNIQVSELLKTIGKPAESLSGALTTNLAFTGKGLDWPSLQNTINSKGEYKLSEGGINSPITSALAIVLDMPELNNIEYKDLSGSFDIVDGNVQLDASLKGSQFDLESEGTVGLNGDLNMPLSLNLSPEYSQKLVEKTSFSKHLADEQGRVSLRLKMTGTTSNPKIRVDEKQAVEKAKQIVVKKAGEELQKVINKELGATSEEGDIVKGISEKFLQEMFKK